jgi:autotransporter-associated beta strand protein
MQPRRMQSTTFTGRKTTSFSFPKFDQNRLQLSTNLTFTGNSTVSQGALQVTPDSGNNFSTYLTNQAGRVFYSTPFVLWAAAANSNASSAAADGRRVASFSNGFVAVELDTVKQPYDPDGNHIGLDVNGVRSSSATCPLAALGIELAPGDTGASDGSNFVWVDYDGAAWRLRAYISPNGTKPSAAALDASLDLSAIVAARDTYFGFSASTGADDYLLNCVKMWNMTIEVLHDDDDDRLPKKLSGWKLGLVVGASCAAALAALGLLVGLYLMKKWRKVGDDPIWGNQSNLHQIWGLLVNNRNGVTRFGETNQIFWETKQSRGSKEGGERRTRCGRRAAEEDAGQTESRQVEPWRWSRPTAVPPPAVA